MRIQPLWKLRWKYDVIVHVLEFTSLQSTPTEPGFIDASVEMVNAFVSRMLSGLPDMTSVDLSMDTVKTKGQ